MEDKNVIVDTVTDKEVQLYVCGFIVHNNKVVLINKARGKFKGFYNGIGGKFEEKDIKENDVVGQALTRCMQREAFEESGIVLRESECELKCTYHGEDFTVAFFLCKPKTVDDLKSSDEGEVAWFDINALPKRCLQNVKWLIPMCLDHYIKFPVEILDHGYPDSPVSSDENVPDGHSGVRCL